MKKKFLLFILVTVVTIISTKIVYASFNSSKGFGGKITDTKAEEVREWEDQGYTCEYPGTTITINPIKNYPSSYAIPYSVKSKTGTTPRSGQWILGLYGKANTTITCTKPCPPPPGNECVEIVTLDVISLYGTSK